MSIPSNQPPIFFGEPGGANSGTFDFSHPFQVPAVTITQPSTSTLTTNKPFSKITLIPFEFKDAGRPIPRSELSASELSALIFSALESSPLELSLLLKLLLPKMSVSKLSLLKLSSLGLSLFLKLLLSYELLMFKDELLCMRDVGYLILAGKYFEIGARRLSKKRMIFLGLMIGRLYVNPRGEFTQPQVVRRGVFH